MDTKEIISKLNAIFCATNKSKRRYSEVWLSEVDFGGLYYSDKHVLNVKAEHTIDSCNDEIKTIIKMLNDKASEELQQIWRVVVYNADNQIHCASGELMVYHKANACP